MHPFGLGHPCEVACGVALALDEACVRAAAHAVDQVVGHVDPLARAAQGVGLEHITVVDLASGRLESAGLRAVAHHRAYLEAAIEQCLGEVAAYRPGGSCYECSH